MLGDVYIRLFTPQIHYHQHNSQPTHKEPTSAKMCNFPQEIIEQVIDELAKLPKEPRAPPGTQRSISEYSTISRQWVERTQKYHFERLCFNGPQDMRKWTDAIEPSRSGVTRHVRTLVWFDINTLEDFVRHAPNFTKVETAIFENCNIFLSFDQGLKMLIPALASSLESLEINGGYFQPEVIGFVLSPLEHLSRFHTLSLGPNPSPHRDVEWPYDVIPFFQKPKDFALFFKNGYSLDALKWIPRNARFSRLSVGVSFIKDNPGVLNRWITSSSDSLKDLHFSADLFLQGASLTRLSFPVSSPDGISF